MSQVRTRHLKLTDWEYLEAAARVYASTLLRDLEGATGPVRELEGHEQREKGEVLR